jgi:hydrogenase/urease accessory protein HupE
VLVAFVSILVVGALMGLIGFALPVATSARATARAVAGARAQLTPAVSELTGAGREIAGRLQRLHPEA